MPLDFNYLIPEIDRVLDEIEEEARRVQGWILTEDDLKCILYNKLSKLPSLNLPSPTQDRNVRGRAVHAEVPWYDEPLFHRHPRLAIKPDITIIEPEHLSILHGYIPLGQVDETSLFFDLTTSDPLQEIPPLPNKQFQFGGKAITFELKFARTGIEPHMMRLIRNDFEKIQRLFRILDNRGEGDTIFSYLVIFDKHGRSEPRGEFADFLQQNYLGDRHKIVYKTLRVQRVSRR